MQTPSSSRDIPELIAVIRGDDGPAREEAREALIARGPSAVPALAQVAHQDRGQSRWEAVNALSKIADPEAAPALVEALEDDQFGARWLAARGLIRIGRPALLPLLETLIETDFEDEVWLWHGAHHVLHDLAEDGVEPDLLEPIMEALERHLPEAVKLSSYDAYKALSDVEV